MDIINPYLQNSSYCAVSVEKFTEFTWQRYWSCWEDCRLKHRHMSTHTDSCWARTKDSKWQFHHRNLQILSFYWLFLLLILFVWKCKWKQVQSASASKRFLEEYVKGPYGDLHPHPPFFLIKSSIFTLVEACRYLCAK